MGFSQKERSRSQDRITAIKIPDFPPEEHEPYINRNRCIKAAVSRFPLPPMPAERESPRFEQSEEKPLFVKVEGSAGKSWSLLMSLRTS